MSETEILNEKQDKKRNEKWKVSETHCSEVFFSFILYLKAFLSCFQCCYSMKKKKKNKPKEVTVSYPNAFPHSPSCASGVRDKTIQMFCDVGMFLH